MISELINRSLMMALIGKSSDFIFIFYELQLKASLEHFFSLKRENRKRTQTELLSNISTIIITL